MPHGIHNQACIALLNYLAELGISAVVGHSKRSSRSPTMLTVYCHDADDVPKVPLGFNGYRVYASTQAEADRLLRAEGQRMREQQPD